MQVFINDRFFPEQEAVISVLDRGFLYGDGVFETLRAYQGKIFRLHDHVSRLLKSARTLCIPLPLKSEEIGQILFQALEVNRLADAYLRVTVSRGIGPPGLDPGDASSPTVVVMARPPNNPGGEFYEQGVSITVVKTCKPPAAALDPSVKSLNFLPNVLAKREASAAGAYEGILLNQDGYLCEGTSSNLFLVRKGRLLTPAEPCEILEGITRRTVLELASQNGIPCEEGQYRPEDLLRADECFLTNTMIELLPAVKISGPPAPLSGHPIGAGQVGEVTRFLTEAYRRRVALD